MDAQNIVGMDDFWGEEFALFHLSDLESNQGFRVNQAMAYV